MSAAQHDTDGVKSMESIINTDSTADTDTEESPEERGRHYRNDGETGQFSRILAQAVRSEGTTPQPRHRRYREDDEENEVLTRVLGR